MDGPEPRPADAVAGLLCLAEVKAGLEAVLSRGTAFQARVVTAAEQGGHVMGLRELWAQRRNSGSDTRGLQRQLESHRQKLADYQRDPDGHDNKGFLRDADPALRAKIIAARVRELEGQVRNFERQIRTLQGGQ